MARRNRFDKAIKGKVTGYQAEPSARVWAGIREAVPGKTGPNRSLYIKMAAVLVLIGLAGGAWWYLSGPDSTYEDKGGKQLTQQSQTQPEGQKPSESPIVANNTETNSTEANTEIEGTEAKTETVPTDGKNNANEYVNSSTRKSPIANRAELKTNKKAKTKEDNNIDLVNEPIQEVKMEGIEETAQINVADEAPIEEVPSTLQEVIAREDAEEKQGTLEEEEHVEGESETGRKRRLNLSNLNREDVRSKTGTVLGNLAQGAGEAIGIQSKVKKTETEERKTKEVTVKFGPLKFKRVKNTKR